ncbi:hypothetical protein [Subtercola endophyticus]|uniref:hypothetical protein n=1 Tax=Subtercola endophyticus TaxID=2895559 RepID=UPI001E336870|nr:hypothetical protein [Subtercola endophyticus]UFS57537.1 hypothetical protein LQ955_10735 [Subtercola endophyticus]
MTLTPEPASPPTPARPRHRRGLIAAGSAVGIAAVIGLGFVGATAAFAGGPVPTPSASASASASAHAHAGLRAGPLRRELENDIRSSSDAGTRAQKIATTLVNSPTLFAKFPANLQTDLTTLKNATGADVATDAANVKTTALSGGYGATVQKVAERIQTRVQSGSAAHTATPTPSS